MVLKDFELCCQHQMAVLVGAPSFKQLFAHFGHFYEVHVSSPVLNCIVKVHADVCILLVQNCIDES